LLTALSDAVIGLILLDNSWLQSLIAGALGVIFAARLKLVQDSGSLLRLLFSRNLPIGEQLIDSRKSLLHGLLWLGQTFDLSKRAELLHEHLHSRCYVVNVSGR
jgi:hypothetical protein